MIITQELEGKSIMTRHKEKPMTTYDELMQNPAFSKLYKKKYYELVLSELLLAIMQEDNISIRNLAKQAGVSPTIIQDLRSGKRDNITLKTFSVLLDNLGYDIILEKRETTNRLPKRVKMKSTGARNLTRNNKLQTA